MKSIPRKGKAMPGKKACPTDKKFKPVFGAKTPSRTSKKGYRKA
jgi:hypothetical protein